MSLGASTRWRPGNAQPLTVRVWTERELGTPLRILNLFIQTDTAVRDVRIVARDDEYELCILLEPISDRRLAALEAKILSMTLVDRAQFPAPTTPTSQA